MTYKDAKFTGTSVGTYTIPTVHKHKLDNPDKSQDPKIPKGLNPIQPKISTNLHDNHPD
jgi:hypothetical protein